MQEGSRAVLKATGETVLVISSIGNRRYLVRLPPQQRWHRPRYQEIHEERLSLAGQ